MRALQHPGVSGKAERSAGQARKEGTAAMEKYIGCDSHQRYSVFVTMDEKGEAGVPVRVEHSGGELRKFLGTLPPGAPVAVEASGGWYWFVDALEQAGLEPHLANPLEAKKQMPGRKKTDKLDARGLATLLRVGTLPEVWIPPAKLRDLRGLMRTRLSMRQQGTFLKNRIHAAIRRYGLRQDAFAGLFSGKARITLSGYIDSLPDHTRFATTQEWEMLNQLERHIDRLEVRIREGICKLGWVRLLKTLPGVGDILGATIHLEIGDVNRFPAPPHLAAYAGLVPSVHSSGGKTHYGPTSAQANHYLKWAFVEAANAIVMHRDKYSEQHVGQLYQRLKERKCHGKAATAVARHLAESSWWILKKKQEYRAPHAAAMSSSRNG
jgi:transposase